MSAYKIFQNPFNSSTNQINTPIDKCKYIFSNNIVSMNPNIAALQKNTKMSYMFRIFCKSSYD